MDDMISRRAAIDALAKFVPYAICDESTESYTNGLTDAYNLILQLPSAQRWIPCETALPKKANTRVIIQTNAGSVIIDCVYGGADVYGHHVWRDGKGRLYWDDEIVAWMPGFIPEPYKEHTDAD